MIDYTLIEDNMVNYWSILASTGKMTIINDHNIVRTESSIPDALFNSVILRRSDDISVEKVVQDSENHYLSKKLPFCWWIESDNLHSNEIMDTLHKGEYISFGKVVGMHISLNETLPHELPANYEMIEDLQSLDQWILPLKSSFHMSDDGAKKYKSMFESIYPKHFDHLLITKDKKPIASCTVMYDANKNTAAIYNCATEENHRKQGLMSSLITKAMSKAHLNGYTSMVLQASPDGYSLFKKIGFNDLSYFSVFMKSV